MRKAIALLLALCCAVCLFSGCDAVSEVTDNVLAAAREELMNQIRAKIEENKVTVVEAKSTVGKLNDAGGKYQFFCAMLVQTNSADSAENCAQAVAALFGRASYMAQTGSHVESQYLVHKTITYNHTDFSAGNYYTVFVYVEDLTAFIIPGGVTDDTGNATTAGNGI